MICRIERKKNGVRANLVIFSFVFIAIHLISIFYYFPCLFNQLYLIFYTFIIDKFIYTLYYNFINLMLEPFFFKRLPIISHELLTKSNYTFINFNFTFHQYDEKLDIMNQTYSITILLRFTGPYVLVWCIPSQFYFDRYSSIILNTYIYYFHLIC